MHSIEATTKLERAVKRIALDNCDLAYHKGNRWQAIKGFARDLAQGGCASGVVSGLIYFRETCAFYSRHKTEINALLCEMMQETGAKSPGELLRDFDPEDPLAQDDANQNLLAWFAFEETFRRMFESAGGEF